MSPSNHPSWLPNLVSNLRDLSARERADQILWLAAEGKLEVLDDGSIGFWSSHPDIMRRAQTETVRLPKLVTVDPTWKGPSAGEGAWCSVAPRAIESLTVGSRGNLEMSLREFTVRVRVEAEEGVRARATPRKGPARLYPRLARRKAA